MLIIKGKHLHSLHEVLTQKEDTEKRIFVNRDVNACKNILSIDLYYLKHIERPKELIRIKNPIVVWLETVIK